MFVLVLTGSRNLFAQQPWPLWESYARFAIDQQGRVIDHSAQDRTTSEGQSYALFFALVANDRARFDKILEWTQINLARGDLSQHLPAWNWGKASDGSWKILDPNSAADADLWIAYDLCEAGRLWKDPKLSKLGVLLAARVAQFEVVYVPHLGTTLVLGANGFHPAPDVWLLNPSYLPPPLIAYFAKTIPTGPWRDVLDSIGPILAQGSAAGFAMDWVSAGTIVRPSISPGQLASGATDKHATGSYDAIRVYLWLGLSDPATPTVRRLFPLISGMANYLLTHPAPPEQVDDAGRIVSPNSPPGFSGAVIPYLHALNLKVPEKTQVDRLSAARNGAGLYGQKSDYYDQNLALFGTGWMEQHFRFDRDGFIRVKWH